MMADSSLHPKTSMKLLENAPPPAPDAPSSPDLSAHYNYDEAYDDEEEEEDDDDEMWEALDEGLEDQDNEEEGGEGGQPQHVFKNGSA